MWVICGSHQNCSVGQWVKWVNRCDPLSTLTGICILKKSMVMFHIKNYSYHFTLLLKPSTHVGHKWVICG